MTTAAASAPPRSGRALPTLRALRLPRPELGALLLLAAVLNLWALDVNGWANEYYTAAVRSMSESWNAFLFGTFDASGVMTVDKPPMALWVQALSVRVFGFHPLSILVPQALMGIATVALAYDLVRRRFGRRAGFVAGLVLALTPITVAISRHNNPDALLVLCCTGALWAAVRALEDGRTRWLVLSGLLVGLGFETKMAVALMVVPGIVAAYLWVAPKGRIKALGQLLAAGAAMVAAGGFWPVIVALTPASDRPWISGTSDNSIWSLILGYNGLGRLTGQAGGPGGNAMGIGTRPPGGVFGGETGWLRLLDSSMGGQAGWFLGFALVSGAAVLAASRLRRADARTGWLIAVGGAFLTTAVAFSFAQGIFHPYYVSLLAPFTAALVGAGAAQLAGGGTFARIAAPVAVLAGVAAEVAILRDNPDSLPWLPGVLIAAGVAAAAALALLPRRAIALAAAIGVLLIAPAAWSAQTLGHAASGTFPAGGPAGASTMGGPGGGGGRFAGGPPQGAANGGFTPPAGGPPATAQGGPGGGGGGGGGGMFGGDTSALTDALAYTRAHGGGTIAVASQSGAGAQVIDGAEVAAIGGFSGNESEVGVQWLADAVASGRIRWVLTSGGAGFDDGRTGSRSVMAAVKETCNPVDSVSGLYDCQGEEAALAATAS
jgi:4-amino-4-deoxy-L-arabinose transferase-like glycosyltransferase